MRIIIAVWLVLSVASTVCGAATIRVPDDAETIQADIALASEGDTVLVAPGVYSGTGNIELDFGGTDLSLISEQGSEETVIVSTPPTEGGIALQSGETNASLVCGFTFLGGAYGIDCAGASPRIEQCEFRQLATGLVLRESGAQVSGCDFIGNRTAASADTPQPLVSFAECVFTDNVDAGILCNDYAEVQVEACRFERNGNRSMWGALWLAGHASVADCVFTGNAGAIFCGFGQSPEITRCTFLDNSVQGWGAVGCPISGSPSVSYCSFSETSGPAIYCGDRATPMIEHSILAFGATGEAVYCEGDAEPLLSCCDIFGNADGDWTGCIADQLGIRANISVNPLFCGQANPDEPLSLTPESPCLDWCGGIGACEIGCEYNTMIPETWGRIKATYR